LQVELTKRKISDGDPENRVWWLWSASVRAHCEKKRL